MSGPIKPEDIPNELMAEFGHIYGPDLVAFLNAAVEAGVVSPPVWRLKRRNNGKIIGFVLNMEDAIRADAFMPTVEVEHWKGQVE